MRSLYAFDRAPVAQERVDAANFGGTGEAASRPDAPTAARPGHVVVSIVSDAGTPAEVHVPADDDRLPDLLARRATRVRAVAPGVVLPDAVPDPATPITALHERYRPNPQETA